MDGLKKCHCSRHGHKSHLSKILSSVEEILHKLTCAQLEDANARLDSSDTLLLTEQLKNLKAKAEVFTGLDEKIITMTDDEEKLEAAVFESADLQTMLSEKIALVTYTLQKNSPQRQVEPHAAATINPHSDTEHDPSPEQHSHETDNISTLSPHEKSPESQEPTTSRIHQESPSPLLPVRSRTNSPIRGTTLEQFTNNFPPPHMRDSREHGETFRGHSTTRLPKLDIPTFTGQPLESQPFWDCFAAAIDSNPSLTGVQKLSYLRAQLRGEATRAITGFPLTNLNYQHSVSILKDRYGQPHKIINAHVQALLELPRPANKLTSLRLFYDTIESHVRCLQSLGKSLETLETLLVPMISTKLPEETKKNMARDHPNNEWRVAELQAAILKEIKVFEIGQQTVTLTSQHQPTPTASFYTAANRRSGQTRREGSTKPICAYCKGNHAAIACEVYKDVPARLEVIKQGWLCYNCLAHHRVSQCSSKYRCRKCSGKHHTSICCKEANKVPDNDRSNESKEPPTTSTATLTAFVPPHLTRSTACLLKTAIATVVNDDLQAEANILFDEGSQRTFITEKLANMLALLPHKSEHINLSSFGSSQPLYRQLNNVVFHIKTQRADLIPISALVVPSIASPLTNTVSTTISDMSHLKGLPLAHPVSSEENFEISLLIGADLYWELIGDHIIRGDGPTAVSSRLGYLLSGPLPVIQSNTVVTSLLNVVMDHETDEQNLQKFWTIEDAGITTDGQDKQFLEHYSATHITRQEDGSYCAMFPWKDDHPPLSNNYQVCQGRTRSMIHRLAQSPGMLQTYDNILKDQVSRGFIEPVMSDKKDSTHYLPHHPVKKDSVTTPIRIVYDCSCRTSANQASLNDCLLTGPPFLNDLVSIILCFRTHQYGISTDIEKAFLHIILHEKDRDFTRFLWLSDATDPNSEFATYHFRTVLFGSVSSPFMLFATLNYHLQQYDNPTSHDIRSNLYVDNVVTGCDSEIQALQFYHQARSMLSAAKFNLRSWASNSQRLLEIAQQDGTADEKRLTNVLGIQWNSITDQLSLTLKGLRPTTSPVTTKREVLQDSSKLFDPLGIVSPVSVRAKLFIQRLWQLRIMWDEPLDKDHLDVWTAVLTDICKAADTSIERRFFTTDFSEPSVQLHVFADASTKAYGAAAFFSRPDQTTFVMAKGRVAPLKPVTLPKLELMAAVIAARLARFVLDSLRIDVPTHLWTDSQIVLFWLQSTKSLPQFIKHRVSEISKLTPNASWRHCPSAANPADLLTRGISFEQFISSNLWWHGPEWLRDQQRWPSWDPQLHVAAATAEEFVVQLPTAHHNIGLHIVITPDKFSSLEILLTVTAYVQWFIDNLRLLQEARRVGPLTSTELSTAKQKWIKNCQEQAFASEISILKSAGKKKHVNKTPNLVRQLRLFLHKDGFVRCGGRIHNAPLSDIARFPYLLPQKHDFTKLLIYSFHNNILHGGVNRTLTTLRQEYWVPSGRQYIKTLLRFCVRCKRHHGKPYPAPESAPLPKDRLRDAAPFTITGVDFTGALYVQDNTGESKVYICLFTCSNTRAIHLEVVTDLTTETFMLAFRRFVSRKSLPHIMMSDNASTYLSAAEDLKGMLNSKELETSLGRRGVTWKFIPKRAPWFGGYWERLIGLTKATLKKVLGRAHISLPMLQTLVVEVEATLNDRPLTYLSDDLRDPQPLTPSSLLYGRRITALPYRTVTEEDIQDPDYGNSESQMRRSTKKLSLLLKNFQGRWKHEYLTSLREFHKSQGSNHQRVKVGDVVQIHDEGPRLNWRLAVIEELITGNDGIVRAAYIRTSTGRTNRPIVKLYPLEINTSETPTTNDRDLQNYVAAEDIQNPGQERRPQRAAAQRAKKRVTEWIQAIRAPPRRMWR